MDTKDMMNVVQAVQTLTLVSHGLINALELLREGRPEDVDLENLKELLLSLPDLPVEPMTQEEKSE